MRRLLAAVCVSTFVGSGVMIVAPVASANGVSTVPKPDHIVVVLEENKASQKILGNPDAPYINSLATSGANMSDFFAETHPSQPNYLALFSGSTQGVTDDSCPHTFGVDNLGSELIAAGDSFTGYSESLPSVGYTGCTSGLYARKHSPWVNFSNLPASTNQPFTSFPSDYSQLPDVSFVIPNLDDDMHNGTIAQGDAWLQNNLAGYVTWAQTHNSVLALTFDEDDHSEDNQIPTMLVGQPVQPGNYAEQVNHYNLLRTIEDAYGIAPLGASASAAPIADSWNPPVGDQSPVAVFSLSCAELTCSFDGSASTDPDGTIASYSWNFGDGESGSGASVTHTYASAGPRPVTVTVTDDQGGSSSVTHSAAPANPGGTTVASDRFGRSVPSGWGSADQGGAWSLSGTGSSVLSVSGGAGQMRLTKPGAGPVARLAGVSATDVNMLVDVSVDKVTTGGGLAAVLVARHSGSSEYRLRLRLLPAGAVHLALARVASGASTTLRDLLVPSVTYAAGQVLRVRFVLQSQGQSTAASASVWDAAGAEPGNPQLTVTDSSIAVAAAGSIGIQSWLASDATSTPVTASYDNFAVASADAGQGGQNQPPTAAFTSQCTQLSCQFDASGSSDSDGTVSGYSWDFGDSSSGSGAEPAHAYATADTYPVKLTVTDNAGGTDSVTHDVTVASGSQSAVVAADEFGRSVPSGWGSADQGGAWSLSGTGSSVLSVSGGTGQMRLTKPGASPVARLAGTSATDVNMLVDVSLDKVVTSGSELAAVLVARHSGSSEYRLRLRLLPAGVVHLAVARVVSGASTTLRDVRVSSLTYAAGQALRVRFVLQTQGQSTLASASVWDAAGSEPGSPQLTATDTSTAVGGAGAVGVQSWLAKNATNTPVTVSYDNFALTDLN